MSLIDVQEETEELLNEKEEYAEILRRIVAWEDMNPKPESSFNEDEPYETWWTYDEVSVQGTRCAYLVSQGIATKVFDSNNTTAYTLKDRETVREVVGPESIEELKRKAESV